MPLTRISAPRHLPHARVKALADAAQETLVSTCNVPANDLFQLLAALLGVSLFLVLGLELWFGITQYLF